MKGKEYLKFLDKWEFLDELPIERIQEFASGNIEDLLTEWIALHEYAFRSDDTLNNNELPIIPISAIENINPDLIANIALYNDRQIIRDPIDIAFEESWREPLNHKLRFLGYFKEEIRNIIKLEPLIQENLIDFMPCTYLMSKIPSPNKFYQDWPEDKMRNYIMKRAEYKIYPEDNILVLQIGDSRSILFARFGKIAELDENTRIVYSVVPPNLNDTDVTSIKKWKDYQLNKFLGDFIEGINEKILIARSFSESLATDEMVTYNYIKYMTQDRPEPPLNITVHKIPILGKINIEKFLKLRSDELPSFSSFRQEWREGRGLFERDVASKEWTDYINNELNTCEHEINKAKSGLFKDLFVDGSLMGMGVAVDLISGNLSIPSLATAILDGVKVIRDYFGYKKNIAPIEASTPFLLLNVIDTKSNTWRTDIPECLPEKPPLEMESLIHHAPMMDDTFF
jgi:hypothetical protein